MPTINTHYPYLRKAPTSIHSSGTWGYGSKGANVSIPNSYRILDENNEDVTDLAFVSPTQYPNNTTSCNVTISVYGASTSGWTSASKTETVQLVDEIMVLDEEQEYQREGYEPTLRFSIKLHASDEESIPVPSDQVFYSMIDGVSVSTPRWRSGHGTQKFTAYCNYDEETGTFSPNGSLRLMYSGEADIYGFGVQGRTIYLNDDNATTTVVDIPMNRLHVSTPTLYMYPSNRALYAELVGDLLKMTVQNDSLEANEESYQLTLESTEISETYEFNVSKRALTELSCAGTAVAQTSGEEVNLSGLTFTARYEDGNSRILPITSLSYERIVPSDTSQMALSVSYTDWGKYSHKYKNNASTVVLMPVYGIKYIGGSTTIEPNDDGEYPSVSSLFEPSLSETIVCSPNTLSMGENIVTATGQHNDSLTVRLNAIGGIGSMELLTKEVTWSNNNDVKVSVRVATDGSRYFHSSVREITPSEDGNHNVTCNVIGSITEGGDVDFTLDADGNELNTEEFLVILPNGSRGTVRVRAKLDTENTVFPTTIGVNSNREWGEERVQLSTSEGCDGCMAPTATVESDEELYAVYRDGYLTLREGNGARAGETYTFTLNGEEHEVTFLGKYQSASLPLDSKTIARGTSFEISPVFTAEDGGEVHKSEMPTAWYLLERSDGDNCLSITDGRVTSLIGKTTTNTSLALMLNWGDSGRYGTIPSTIGGDVTVYDGIHTSLGITGDCELSFNIPQNLLSDHTYVFHSGYKWNLLEDGDEMTISFLNGEEEVHRITRVGRYREYDSVVVTVNDEEVGNYNTGWDIPVGISNEDGRYLDSEDAEYTKYEGSFDIPFSVQEDVTFNKIIISADVHGDDELEEEDYEMLLSDPFITDLGQTLNLVVSGEIDDDAPDILDYIEEEDDGFSIRTTPNIGSWNPTTGELIDDIVGVSFKSNTIALQNNNYYYINCIPLQYENYKYLYATLGNDTKHTESKGFVYRANGTSESQLAVTYDGHSGTVEGGDINPWLLRLDKYTPYVVSMGSANDDDDCWALVNNRNFIGFEAPVDTMTITIT